MKQNLPVIVLFLLVILLLLGYVFRDNLNQYISGKMRDSAGTGTILSGKEWVDSLFNYTENGKDFHFTLLQFKSAGCSICRRMNHELELVKKAPGKIQVVVLNIMNPNSQNVMKYFGISAIPTQLILDKQGNEIFRNNGFITAKDLLAKIKS